MRLLVAFFTVLIAASCSGYHLQKSNSSQLIHVPFIQNDNDGLLTNSVVKALAQHGFAVDLHAPYILTVGLESKKTKPLGYTYGYDSVGSSTKALYSNEARLEWACYVAIKRKSSEQLLAGPQILTASSDFDYEIEEMHYSQVQQSAGQLNIRHEAIQTAQDGVKEKLANEIASWVLVHWSEVVGSVLPKQ